MEKAENSIKIIEDINSFFCKNEINFWLGHSAYLKTDPDQCERLITGINIREKGIMYELSYINSTSWHYSFELSSEKDLIKSTS